MQKYKTVKTLGDGAFGSVYKAQNIKTGEIVAIKKMKEKYKNWNECIDLRQIKSLRKMSHENIIKLKQVLLVSEELYLVFEYLDYNLYEVYAKMKEQGKFFTENQIKSIFYQILNGLAHMHKNGFFHRDMKPENLLIYNNVAKIADLGLAREIRSRPPFTDYVSTRWYRAPQLLLRSTNYNSPVDIFALGCIMAELYTLSPLFAGTNEIDQMNKIVKVLGTPEKGDWPEGYKLAQNQGYYFPEEKGINLGEIIPRASSQALDLIESMLKYSSRKRPTATELLKHDYFQNVNIPETIQTKKQIVFEENPSGFKLDTSKEDKNMDVFRATKEKFKQTRKHDALDSNPFKVLDNNSKTKNDFEDIDSLIKELEEKGTKKKDKKLPLIQTKEKQKPALKLSEKVSPVLRESKTEVRVNQYSKYNVLADVKEWNTSRGEGSGHRKKEKSGYKTMGENNLSRKGKEETKKFAYSFQPAAFNPAFLPKGKSISNLGYNPLPLLNKPRTLVNNPIYKF